MSASADPAPSALLRRRLDCAVRVAGAHGTTLSLERLSDLLPSEAPRSPEDLARLVRDEPRLGEVVAEEVVPEGVGPGLAFLEERRARGRAYWAEAEDLWARTFPALHPLLRTLLVTGSTAYGEPDRGDDLDLFAITRTDAVWAFLGVAFFLLRRRRWREGPSRRAPPCFNFVIDDVRAREEFRRPRGFLFAREALMSRPVAGRPYFESLVADSGWMHDELPRLYERWTSSGPSTRLESAPSPWVVRLLNLAGFPLLATYLQLAGLYRNHRFRREGRPERAFRTRTRYRGLALETQRFDRLQELYAPASQRTRGAPS